MKSIKVLFLLAVAMAMVEFASAQNPSIDTSKIGDNKKTGHYIKIRGFNMYYETYGAGAPLLLRATSPDHTWKWWFHKQFYLPDPLFQPKI